MDLQAERAESEQKLDIAEQTLYAKEQEIGMLKTKAGDLERQRNHLTAQLTAAKLAVERILCTQGCDAGVVLLSNQSTSHYDPEVQGQVYDHEYFSPLGDALIELYETLGGEVNSDAFPTEIEHEKDAQKGSQKKSHQKEANEEGDEETSE